MVAAVFRTILAQPHAEAVSDTWDEVHDQLTRAFPKIGPLMDEAKTEVLAFTAFPRAHWQKIWSTNPLERVNEELKRRARVVGIFANPASVIRFMGAVLADMHDEWQAGDRRYLSEGSMALLCRTVILERSPRSTVASRHRDQPQSPPPREALPKGVAAPLSRGGAELASEAARAEGASPPLPPTVAGTAGPGQAVKDEWARRWELRGGVPDIRL